MLRTFVAAVSLSLLASLSLASVAQAQQGGRPDPGCGRDVSRHCRSVMDQGDGVILNCLQKNRARLSRTCAKVLTDNGQ